MNFYSIKPAKTFGEFSAFICIINKYNYLSYTNILKDKINLEEMQPIYLNFHSRQLNTDRISFYKSNSIYKYFIENPKHMSIFDLEKTQDENPIFSNKEYDILKLLNKII